MIHTALCDLLDIPYPIIQGGMAWVSDMELVVAVSEAGGLGVIGAGSSPVEWVAGQIDAVRERTGRPFGVNVPLFSPYAAQVIQLCIDKRVPVVTTGAGSPGTFLDELKEAGIVVFPLVASVALAQRMARMGADGVIAEGHESGGHIGDVSTLPLIPQVVDAVDVPVIAAGGIADGRGVAAALSLGAAGVQMGTRFICTTECSVHPNYKAKVLGARDRSTVVTGHSWGHPVRTIKNKMSREMARMEREDSVTEEELIAFGTGKLCLAAREGDTDGGSVMAGQISGMIEDIVPCRVLLDRIMASAEERIKALGRLCQ